MFKGKCTCGRTISFKEKYTCECGITITTFWNQKEDRNDIEFTRHNKDTRPPQEKSKINLS